MKGWSYKLRPTSRSVVASGQFRSHVALGEHGSFTSSLPPNACSRPSFHRKLSELSDVVRSLMRSQPQAPVICTSTETEIKPEANGGVVYHTRGMTISTFTTVSLDPKPIITFNVKTPSRTLDAIRQSGRLNIHLLHGNVEGARLAERFIQANNTPAAMIRSSSAADDSIIEHGSPHLPIKLNGPAVKSVLACRLAEPQSMLRFGSHVVVFAEVISTTNLSASGTDEYGLLYVDHQYRQTGHAIRLLTGEAIYEAT